MAKKRRTGKYDNPIGCFVCGKHTHSMTRMHNIKWLGPVFIDADNNNKCLECSLKINTGGKYPLNENIICGIIRRVGMESETDKMIKLFHRKFLGCISKKVYWEANMEFAIAGFHSLLRLFREQHSLDNPKHHIIRCDISFAMYHSIRYIILCKGLEDHNMERRIMRYLYELIKDQEKMIDLFLISKWETGENYKPMELFQYLNEKYKKLDETYILRNKLQDTNFYFH